MIEQEIAQLESVYQIIIDFLVRYSFQLVAAVLILFLGLWFASRMGKLVYRLLESKSLDITLANFIGNVVKVLLIAMTVIICLGKLGISITPFVAALGAISLGAGLAIQGTLSNYGAGLAIILTRPFVLKNTLSVRGYTGIVEEINLSTTVLVNEDGERITIPNRHIVGEILKNTQQFSLIEGSVDIAYQNDPKAAIAIIEQCLDANPCVVEAPKQRVGIEAFADSGIRLSYRFWVETPQLHELKFAVNMSVFDALKAADISIPYPQSEVRLLKDEQ
ncbi:mechanosensitive ion channel family protein [Alginatibacterium sediminis]|uniref:Small-conductance mechanosensitive channel n=1 Tax=Alginatibacterium sediminis TaxID=2164068 RepID=A0A420EDP9_9ALTE|nr:mechanosensitive ion channel family protein [Alginatibacterium sediminis]RKF18801.1 mechanosensitive ion channel family protein [Alginatibacterium sediminis]